MVAFGVSSRKYTPQYVYVVVVSHIPLLRETVLAKRHFGDAVSEYVGGLEPKKVGMTARGLRGLGGRGEEEKKARREERGQRGFK